MSKRLLALDQSSNVSGEAVFINKELVYYSHFSTDSTQLGEKLYQLRKHIKELIDEYKIDTVAFEDIQLQSSVGNNAKTFKVLGNVQGVVLELVHELDLNYIIVPSSSWKSTLEIKGKGRSAQKRAAQEYVLETYGVKATQDESDAICIGTHTLKNPEHGSLIHAREAAPWD